MTPARSPSDGEGPDTHRVHAPAGQGLRRGEAPATLAQYRMALLIALRDAMRRDPFGSAPAEAWQPTAGRPAGVRLVFEHGRLLRGESLTAGNDGGIDRIRRQALQVARDIEPPSSLSGQAFVIEIELVSDETAEAGAS